MKKCTECSFIGKNLCKFVRPNFQTHNMRSIILSLLLLLLFGCKSEINANSYFSSTSDTLRVATFNVRIRTNSDRNERSWVQRKEHVAELINSYRMDIVGVQEMVDIPQENDLKKLLPNHNSFTRGRDDTQAKTGERLGIFYHRERFLLLDSGFFFLSETPGIASKGWDAALNRICQWVYLHDKVTQKDIYVFNTHFDHQGRQARAKSAALVVSKIHEIARENPVFLIGDINASPYETEVYDVFSNTFNDARHISPVLKGPAGTFNGWRVQNSSFGENLRIDYIFLSKGIEVTEYRVINDQFVPETFPSDHFPVLSLCLFQ